MTRCDAGALPTMRTPAPIQNERTNAHADSLINFLNGAVLVLSPLIGLLAPEKYGYGLGHSDVGLLTTVFAVWATVFQFTVW